MRSTDTTLIRPAANSPAPIPSGSVDGYVDAFGYAAAAKGWVFIGWLNVPWADLPDQVPVTALFQQGRLRVKAMLCSFHRPDLTEPARGIVLFVSAPTNPLGEFLGLEITLTGDGGVLRVPAVRPLQHLPEAELVARAQGLVKASLDATRTKLGSLLRRRPYMGVATLDQLPVPVQFEADATVLASPDGLLVLGWMLDPTGSVAAMRVRSGPFSSEPVDQRWIRTRRQDVTDAFVAQYGTTDARCGFVAYAPRCVMAGEPLYIEIELHAGEIAYKPLPTPVYRGMAAVRRVLETVDLAPDEIAAAFDRVLGPPLVAINQTRLAQPRPRSEIVFGTLHPDPVCSIIIPLYGRMDFLMYQLALMSETDLSRHEIIYVLDDPPRKKELLALAESVWQRFGLPFRVIALEENLGFAPANNVGLEYARGEYLCYLNSDVMPDAPDWLERMLQDLREDPSTGVVGGLLLFEDGTVQHEGMTYERLPDMGNWPFPMHPNKGRLPVAEAGLVTVEAVTGACMVLRTELARALGGFDEVYAIGDFEDSDLCLKVKQQGLRCVVDRRARLWHLERQSQVSPDQMWRMYVTLLNAWTHTKRWFPEPSEAGDKAIAAGSVPKGRKAAAVTQIGTCG